MPPRISVVSRLTSAPLCLRPSPACPFIPSVANASTFAAQAAQKRKRRDPYAAKQIEQRRLANLKRQDELEKARHDSLGDPVRGIETPFVKSFDAIGGLDPSIPADAPVQLGSETLLNHFLTSSELKDSLEHSYNLTKPVVSTIRDTADPAAEEAAARKHREEHQKAVTALTRITSLANSSGKDKTRVNVMRCIEAFGRHNTDRVLKPKPSVAVQPSNQPEKTPRAGPDTGSPEVQVAILTAKIRVLARQLQQKGAQKDKVNKRNLRLLVHRRQKHLKYLRRKERGGERWENLIATLGLTEGTWKGEISL
ncbi:ribosomal protein s15 [Phlyctema vagabunda]|uniref:Ribosomal protein s15 n=1 Tax=Phlyctema vagabunda TaxID=108571 RepID=A0ABR4PXU0_9HELO